MFKTATQVLMKLSLRKKIYFVKVHTFKYIHTSLFISRIMDLCAILIERNFIGDSLNIILHFLSGTFTANLILDSESVTSTLQFKPWPGT